MASGNIKGITIEIGGDTTGLDSALKDVNKQAKNLQSELKEVERGLKLDPGNVELVRQKQNLLTQSIQATSDKLHVLRQAQGQVEQQFRNGEIGEEQYRAFRRELVNTENNMRNLQGQFNSLQTEQQRLTETTRSLGAFFDATGTNVEEFASALGTRLTQAIRNGTASADQMERALRLMGRQALGASTDIDEMRRVLGQINNGGSIDAIRTELQQMNTVVVTTQDELKEIDKLLRFNPNNVELLSQKQALLTRSIQDTSTELQQLQQRQSQVEAQFQSGQIGEEQYRAFRREIEQAEQSLNGYQNQLNAMQQEQQQLQSSTRQLQTLFDATGTSVDQFADVLGNDLVRAIQEGRASSTQIERAIDQIGQASLGAGQDLEEFRNALRNADNGAPIDEIRQDLERLRQDAEQATGSVNNLEKGMDALGDVATAAATGVAAIGAAAGLSAAQFDNATGQIQAALGVTREEAEALEDSAKNVWKAGFGESLADVADGLVRVKQNMKQIDGSEVEKVTKNSLALAKTFESDVNEVTRAGNNLMVNFGVSADEAFDLMTRGAQEGLNFSNEMFDNLAEYSPLFATMGYSAEDYFGILKRGSEAGVYNLDYINDIMKEFQIRVKDGSKATSDSMDQMSASTQKVWEEFLKGNGTVAEVANTVVAELQTMDDQVMANQIAVGLFGTKFEDLESTAVYAMLGTQEGLTNVEGAMNRLNEAQEQTFGQRWESFTRTAAASLEPLGKILLDLAEQWLPKIIMAVEGVAKWFADLTPVMQGVTVGIGAIAAAIGPLIMIAGTLISSIGSIIGLFTSGGVAAGAFSAVIAAMTGPIGLTVAAVAGIGVAIGVLANDLSQSSIEVEGWKGKVSEATAETLGGFMELSDGATTTLNQMNWSGQAVTQEMAAKIVETFANMGNQVLAEMQADHAEQLTELQNFYAQSSVLSDEQEAAAVAKAQTYQANRQQVITDGMARINEITSTAAAERRELTLAEEAEINRIHEQMKEAAITHMSESAEEQKVILEALKNEASEITATQAAEVVKNSAKQKDETVAEAQKQYEESLKIIMQQRDELGVISEEQAELLITEAQRQRDKTIESAEEMHTNVVAEAKTQAKEHVGQVDWTTGEIKSKWQVMKDDTVAKMKELGSAIKRDWTNAYNDTVATVKRMASDVGTWFQNMNDTVVTKVEGVVDSVIKGMSDAYNGAIGKAKEFVQVGADMVSGIIKGIGNMTQDAIDAIAGVVDSVVDKAKSLLDINSPSRVMRYEVGQQVGAGLALGIEDGISQARKSSEKLTKATVEPFKQLPSMIKKYGEEAFEDYQSVYDKYSEIRWKTGDAYGVESLRFLKAAIENEKIAVHERIRLQDLYNDHMELAPYHLADLQREYNDKVIQMETDRVARQKELLAEYEAEVVKKTGEILKQYRLLDKVEIKSTGVDEITSSLESQIESLELYNESIAKLSMRGLDSSLLEEISSLGPKMAGEVAAFANMSEEELNNYVSLWEEKQRLAREMAEASLEATRLEMQAQLQQINADAERELEGFKENFEFLFKEVNSVSSAEMSELRNDMAQDGANAMQGLINGMESMRGSVIATAQSIADAVSSTIQSALDIHSPSRVMKGFGINIGEGLVSGMDNMIAKVAQSSARLAEAVSNVQGSLASSSLKSQAYGSSVSSSTTTVDNRKTFAPVIHNHGSAADTKAQDRMMRRLAWQFN